MTSLGYVQISIMQSLFHAFVLSNHRFFTKQLHYIRCASIKRPVVKEFGAYSRAAQFCLYMYALAQSSGGGRRLKE